MQATSAKNQRRRTKKMSAAAFAKEQHTKVTEARTGTRRWWEKELGKDIERRFRPCLPFDIHDAGDLYMLQRYTAAQLASKARDMDFDIAVWCERAEDVWPVAKAALEAGMRLSIPVPIAWCADMTAIAVQKIDVPMLATFDVIAKRLVLRHEREEEIHNAVDNGDDE